MELHSYLQSQALIILENTPSTPQLSKRSPVPLFREFQDRYGFVQIPRTVDELNLQSGITFARGYFQERVIEKFQVYENGLLCEALFNTDLCQDFLDDVLSWVPNYFADGPKIQIGYRAYLSQMIVSVRPEKAQIFERFEAFGAQVATMRGSYGQLNTKPLQVLGFRMNVDPAEPRPVRAPDFVFERKAEEPFSSGLYFASAPLRTSDHWTMLAELERLLS